MVEQDNSVSPIKNSISEEVIRKYHRTPITLYRLKDLGVEITSNPNFLDSLLVVIALIAFAGALPFYPIPLLIILMAILFIFTLRHAFLGLVLLMIFVFPMVMYQTPSLAYVFVIIISLSLIFGYMHYRTITFAYILIPMALSPLGFLFAIPTFIIGVLLIGYKRAAVLSLMFVFAVVMFSAVTGVQNSAYLIYNAQSAHTMLSSAVALNYSTPNKAQFNILNFGSGLRTAFSGFANINVVAGISSEFGALISALFIQPLDYFIDLVGIIAIAVVIDTIAVNSRSQYKGTQASLIGLGYPALYILLTNSLSTSTSYILPFASFLLAPALLYVLELYKIDIVKALDVRKEDLRLKFGEAFEDLFASGSNAKFSDIGDYEATKKELRDAIVSPIEEKAVSRAYNIKPVKGVLLFGPPGTGKTMLMRAIANDIRAGFYLVKAPNLISAFPGETEKRLSNIFAIARKNKPCVLFFDEIDSIGRSRAQGGADEIHRQVLTELLIQMDGFQKLDNVIVVAATNVPQLLDPALLRPGRLDKIIYMPLPDFNGRREIFKIYLSKLPISRDMNFEELAKKTDRFSGADISVLCEGVAQQIAAEAAKKHKVLEITQEDIIKAIDSTKPSTTLAQLKEYKKFEVDFERRVLGQEEIEKEEKTSVEDVVGLEEAKDAIIDAVRTPLLHPELVQKYGVKTIKGVLMFGPPGNGKTMLMKAITNELKEVTILRISSSDLSDQNPDNALSAIKEIFDRASENTPSIVFIDEIDGLVPKRSESSEFGIKFTTELLQDIDGLIETPGVLLVCATNRPEALDPAILRPGRFDKLIFVKPPDQQQRILLFNKNISGAPVNKDLNIEKLATLTNGFTGADIANICREAKSRALNKSVKAGKEIEIGMEDLEAIIKSFKPSAPDSLVKSYKAFLDKYGQR